MAVNRTVRARATATPAGAVVVAAAALLAGPVPAADAQENSALARGFAQGFVEGFQRTTGVKLPSKEAKCVTDRFLSKVSATSLAKIKAATDMTSAQKSALVDSLANCLSATSYKTALKNKLKTSMSAGQRDCVAENALDRLTVAQMIRFDFATYLGTTGSKTVETTLVSVVETCLTPAGRAAAGQKAGAAK